MARRMIAVRAQLRAEELEARSLLNAGPWSIKLYNDLLQRSPSEPEIGTVISALNHGYDRPDVASVVVQSPEYRGDLVQNDFLNFFGRQPADAESQTWISRLASGMTPAQLNADLLASDEFYMNQGGTDAGWLQGVYLNILGRMPDSSGGSSWMESLAQGHSRAVVAEGITASAEADGIVVTDAYHQLLQREPDAVGLGRWTAAMQGGFTQSQLLATLSGTQEYYDLAQSLLPDAPQANGSLGGLGGSGLGSGGISSMGSSASTTTLKSDSNPSFFVQTVNFTAIVAPLSGSGATPTGTVTFKIDGLAQAPVPIATNGTATYSTWMLATGTHKIQAVYTGDSIYAASSSAVLTETVYANGNALPGANGAQASAKGTGTKLATTSLGIDLPVSIYGEMVTFTAVVKPVLSSTTVPTGSITFTIDGAKQLPVKMSGGQAQLVSWPLQVGVHTISAWYTGDKVYANNFSATITQTVTANPVDQTRGQLFPSNNPWNTNIAGSSVDPNSANLIASIGSTSHVKADFGSTWAGRPTGIPYIVVPGNQPKVPVSFYYNTGNDPGPYPIPPDAPVQDGNNSTNDRHLLILDKDNHKLYELWKAYKNPDGSWHAGSGAIFDLTSNNLRPAGWESADAAGLPILPGLITYDEVYNQKVINHALRFTAPVTRRAFVAPATHWASNQTGTNLPPMGMRVRLKANYDISKFPAPLQVILTAMKNYGMFLADNGPAWHISGAPDARWDNNLLDQLKQVPGSAFEVVKMGTITTQF